MKVNHEDTTELGFSLISPSTGADLRTWLVVDVFIFGLAV